MPMRHRFGVMDLWFVLVLVVVAAYALSAALHEPSDMPLEQIEPNHPALGEAR